jgi:hypothetical protein
MQPPVNKPLPACSKAPNILHQDLPYTRPIKRTLRRSASYSTLRDQPCSAKPYTNGLRASYTNSSSTDPEAQKVSMASQKLTIDALRIVFLNLIANLLTWVLLAGIKALPTTLASIHESNVVGDITRAGNILLSAVTDVPLIAAAWACCICAVVGSFWLFWERRYCVWLTDEVFL